MTPEQALRDKLCKIGALFAGAATDGEKAAAGGRRRRRFASISGEARARKRWRKPVFRFPTLGHDNCSLRFVGATP